MALLKVVENRIANVELFYETQRQIASKYAHTQTHSLDFRECEQVASKLHWQHFAFPLNLSPPLFRSRALFALSPTFAISYLFCSQLFFFSRHRRPTSEWKNRRNDHTM